MCFLFSDSTWDKVQHECIKCLKAIMNNKVMFSKFKMIKSFLKHILIVINNLLQVGLKAMLEHKEALTLLAR